MPASETASARGLWGESTRPAKKRRALPCRSIESSEVQQMPLSAQPIFGPVFSPHPWVPSWACFSTRLLEAYKLFKSTLRRKS